MTAGAKTETVPAGSRPVSNFRRRQKAGLMGYLLQKDFEEELNDKEEVRDEGWRFTEDNEDMNCRSSFFSPTILLKILARLYFNF